MVFNTPSGFFTAYYLPLLLQVSTHAAIYLQEGISNIAESPVTVTSTVLGYSGKSTGRNGPKLGRSRTNWVIVWSALFTSLGPLISWRESYCTTVNGPNSVPVPWIRTTPNPTAHGLPQPCNVAAIPTQSPEELSWAFILAVSVAVTVKEASPSGVTVMHSPLVVSAVPPVTVQV